MRSARPVRWGLLGLTVGSLMLVTGTGSAAGAQDSAVTMAPSTAGCQQAKKDNASVLGKDSSSTSNKVVVIAQDNLWFHGLRNDSAFVAWDGSGRRTSPFEPWIGF